MDGRWVKGPGAPFFEALRGALGELPIVAEDLGVITPEVDALRDRFGFPGMPVLQFAFGADAQANGFRPTTTAEPGRLHRHPRQRHGRGLVDGGWGPTRTAAEVEKEHERALAYCGGDGTTIHWDFVRTLFVSVADTAIVPLQDLLGAGTSARMNLPGLSPRQLAVALRRLGADPGIRKRLRAITEGSGRCLRRRLRPERRGRPAPRGLGALGGSLGTRPTESLGMSEIADPSGAGHNAPSGRHSPGGPWWTNPGSASGRSGT